MEKKKDNPAKMLAEAGATIVGIETKAEPAPDPQPLTGKYKKIADSLAADIKAGKYKASRTTYVSTDVEIDDGTLLRAAARVDSLRRTDNSGTSCKPALDLIDKLDAAIKLVGEKQQRNGNPTHDNFIVNIEVRADLIASTIETLLVGFYLMLWNPRNINEMVGLLMIAEGRINELKKLAKEVPPASQMVRSPRALDAQLLTGYKAGQQIGLFDELEAATQKKVRNLKIDSGELYIGVKLDAGGWELIHTIQTVLAQHSQTINQEAPDYYKGDLNDTNNKLVMWNGEKRPVGYIKTTLGELTRVRTGIDKPNGRDINTTAELLQAYNCKPFVVRYKEYYTETKIVKGKPKQRKSYRTIETAEPLYKAEVTRDNGTRTSCVKIWLTPLFYHQIETNYNQRPPDYTGRVRRAYNKLAGSKQNSTPPKGLEYLLAQLIEAQNNSTCTYHSKLLGEDGLYKLIDERSYKKRMWKDADKALHLFANVATEIGLLESWRIEDSKNFDNKIATFKVVPQGKWI
jgi:hypothetical protein